MKNKKIAILGDSSLEYDARVQRIIKSFEGKGFNVDVFLPDVNTTELNIFNNKVKFYYYEMNNSWLNRNFFFWKQFANITKLVFSKKINYNFIYINDYPLLYSGCKIKEQLKTSLIYDCHEIYIETINQFFPTSGIKKYYGYLLIKLNKFLHFKIEKRLIKKTDFRVTVCDSFKNYFEKVYKLNFLVLKNAPWKLNDLKKSNKIRNSLNLKKEDKIILYQGMFNKSRGLLKLIESFKYVDKSIKLVLLGDGVLKKKLTEFSKKINNVYFIPMVKQEELISYTSSADIGVLFIQDENKSKELTLPNKVFEYMNAGIPYVTNNRPEASKIITENNCGFIFDDQTPELIGQQFNEVINENLKSFGNNGRKAIEQKFIWQKDFELFFKQLT
jgi:glycosyltransferase involved in cell wall biosynthesis